MSQLNIDTAKVFRPLLEPSRYKGAHGGRGSGKSHFFAELLVERCVLQPTRWACIREVQNTIKDSVRQLLADKINKLGLSSAFEILETEIRGPNNSLIIFKGMQHYNASTIKSLEGYDGAWVEEAQDFSQTSLDLLRPTIRKERSELWFSWNPTSSKDPVDLFLRGPNCPKDAIVVEANWKDNPWFPEVLRKEMEEDRAADADKAGHVWDGKYQTAPKGAYYARLLAIAKTEGRIGFVPYDPVHEVRVCFDLGNGPNMSAWFLQWIGLEIRAIDYLQGDEQAKNEGWPWYIKKLREKPYSYSEIVLPHDAAPAQRVTGKGDQQTLVDAGFRTTVVPKMDPAERVKLVQRYLPRCRFDETKCADGLEALRQYQSNYDERLQLDKGPLHNWASHPSDALGHGIQAYQEPHGFKMSGAIGSAGRGDRRAGY